MRSKVYESFIILPLFTIGFLLGILLSENLSTLRPAFTLWPSTSSSIERKRPYRADGTEETLIADVLFDKIRVMCMILTSPKTLVRARHVKSTWAKGCNKYIFISSIKDDTLPSLAAVEREGRDVLWDKTKFAMRYAEKMFGDDYDYFLKADDDTYVIVENLRKLVLGYNSEVPFIMGRRFKPYVKQGYLSGGGGYVLSRSGLRRVVRSFDHAPRCPGRTSGGAEDVTLGMCAQEGNVTLLDSLDEYGVERFHPFDPAYMFDQKSMHATKWILTYNYHKLAYGMNCCSDYSVSFHYISPNDMHVLDLLIYHVRPYGIFRDHNDLDLFAERHKLGTPQGSEQWSTQLGLANVSEQQKKDIFDGLQRRYLISMGSVKSA